MLDWSASWARWFQFAFTTLGQFTSGYTAAISLTTMGCDYSALQWSAIAFGILSWMLAFMDGKYEIGGKAVRMNNASQNIVRLARRIDLQLQRTRESREPVDEFCAAVVSEYDEIISTVPDLPRWIRGDLTNITLLTAYREQSSPGAAAGAAVAASDLLRKSAAGASASTSAAASAAAGVADAAPEMNRHLRAKMEYELERFESHHSSASGSPSSP